MSMRLNRFPDQAPFFVVAEINGSRCRGMSLGEFRGLLGSLEDVDMTFILDDTRGFCGNICQPMSND